MTTIDIDALPSDWEALTSAGREMTEAADVQRWQLGDLANKVARVYGQESIRTFASDINIANHKTLWDYSRVAARFEKSVRNEFPTLSFTHFRTALRAGDDAELWLVKAADNGWPVAELSRQIRAALGQPVPPRLLWEGRGAIYWQDTGHAAIALLGDYPEPLPAGQIVTVRVYENGGEA